MDNSNRFVYLWSFLIYYYSVLSKLKDMMIPLIITYCISFHLVFRFLDRGFSIKCPHQYSPRPEWVFAHYKAWLGGWNVVIKELLS